MADLDALRRVMPPLTPPDTVVDWERLSRSWGTAFPSDYREFMQVYGAGTVQDFLVVEQPEPRDAPSDPPAEGMAHETANAELAWREFGKEPALTGVEPRLIAWGVTSGADILCWDASGDDPDAWLVLVANRDFTVWRRYDCPMVEFLRRVLAADFAECPVSGAAIWGVTTARYLTPREQTRLRKEGLDPWTGEPDPYADMFPI